MLAFCVVMRLKIVCQKGGLFGEATSVGIGIVPYEPQNTLGIGQFRKPEHVTA